MTLVTLHSRLATSCVLYLVMAAIWGLGLAATRQPVSPPYRGMLFIAEALLAIELLVGVVVRFSGPPQLPPPLHFLYGALTVLILPIALGIAQRRSEKVRPLIFGIALLFLTGLSVRATMTGA